MAEDESADIEIMLEPSLQAMLDDGDDGGSRPVRGYRHETIPAAYGDLDNDPDCRKLDMRNKRTYNNAFKWMNPWATHQPQVVRNPAADPTTDLREIINKKRSTAAAIIEALDENAVSSTAMADSPDSSGSSIEELEVEKCEPEVVDLFSSDTDGEPADTCSESKEMWRPWYPQVKMAAPSPSDTKSKVLCRPWLAVKVESESLKRTGPVQKAAPVKLKRGPAAVKSNPVEERTRVKREPVEQKVRVKKEPEVVAVQGHVRNPVSSPLKDPVSIQGVRQTPVSAQGVCQVSVQGVRQPPVSVQGGCKSQFSGQQGVSQSPFSAHGVHCQSPFSAQGVHRESPFSAQGVRQAPVSVQGGCRSQFSGQQGVSQSPFSAQGIHCQGPFSAQGSAQGVHQTPVGAQGSCHSPFSTQQGVRQSPFSAQGVREDPVSFPGIRQYPVNLQGIRQVLFKAQDNVNVHGAAPGAPGTSCQCRGQTPTPNRPFAGTSPAQAKNPLLQTPPVQMQHVHSVQNQSVQNVQFRTIIPVQNTYVFNAPRLPTGQHTSFRGRGGNRGNSAWQNQSAWARTHRGNYRGQGPRFAAPRSRFPSPWS